MAKNCLWKMFFKVSLTLNTLNAALTFTLRNVPNFTLFILLTHFRTLKTGNFILLKRQIYIFFTVINLIFAI